MPRDSTSKRVGVSSASVLCGVCREVDSKYRCSQCPVSCSVSCYKLHKGRSYMSRLNDLVSRAEQVLEATHPSPTKSKAGPSPASDASSVKEDPVQSIPSVNEPSVPLRALTTLSWPPEPDESIYTDPLTKEDPKPLRHSELLRIAQSADLRHLLTSTSLPSILLALDALPTPGARSAMLGRCLSIDPISLSMPSSTSADLLSQRDSPPPLEVLIQAIAQGGRSNEDPSTAGDRAGFWIGRVDGEGSSRVWIGDEERKIMRVFAGLVCRAIDGGEGDAWGQGGLAWEV